MPHKDPIAYKKYQAKYFQDNKLKNKLKKEQMVDETDGITDTEDNYIEPISTKNTHNTYLQQSQPIMQKTYTFV